MGRSDGGDAGPVGLPEDPRELLARMAEHQGGVVGLVITGLIEGPAGIPGTPEFRELLDSLAGGFIIGVQAGVDRESWPG
jgi:hypothetical protein